MPLSISKFDADLGQKETLGGSEMRIQTIAG